MNEIPMLERFAAQSLIRVDGELIFSKERFAQLIVRECADIADINAHQQESPGSYVRQHFGVGE